MSSTALVVTVLNEENSLNVFLDSIDRQQLTPSEVIVVDGGSSDGTVGVLNRWRQHYRGRTTVIVAEGANIAKGRNVGIKKTNAEIIAITDGGCQLHPQWFRAITSGIVQNTMDVCFGPTEPLLSNSVSRAFASIKGDRIQFKGISSSDGVLEASPSSRSIAFRKECALQVGLYPEWLETAEDSYFFYELKKKGFRIDYEPKAVVSWNMRDSIRSIGVQFYKYGIGEIQAGIFLGRAIIRATYFLLPSLAYFLSPNARVWFASLWLIPFALPGWLRARRFIRGTSLVSMLTTIALIPIASFTMEATKCIGACVGFLSKPRRK